MSLRSDKSNWNYNSIGIRLAILYTLSASILLIGVTAFLYEELADNLLEEDKQFLAEKVYIIQNILKKGENVSTLLEQEVRRGIIAEKVKPYYAYFSRILQSGNNAITETPGMSGVLPVTIFPAPIDITQHSNLAERTSKWKAESGNRYLLLAVRLIDKTDEYRVIQVALDVSREDVLLTDYKYKLMTILPIGIMLSAILGILIAHREMRPLQDMTSVAERITASQLHDRIDPTIWPKELRTLAEAFNQMLDRLNDSFTRLTQFSDDLAHEFRTPINNLMGEIQVTLAHARTEKEYRDVLESCVEECGKLSHMIDSLLFLARADNVQIPLQLTVLDARKELEAICDSYDAVLEEKGITTVCEGGLNLIADPALFRRAIANVLSNAIRHTPVDGKIRLIAESAPDAHCVAIRIIDMGCGIANEHLAKVFDRFYRVDQARSSESYNTGLGLAIVKSILALHGGTVTIESQLHQGTSVTLNFPVT